MKSKIYMVLAVFMLYLSACNHSETTLPENKHMAKSGEMGPGPAITWVHSLSEGLELAKQQKKPLMVDFGAEWCGWCKRLDKDVYSRPDVARAAGNFINVKVDTDRYPSDAKRYGVRGLPTVCFLDEKGGVIYTIVGYRESSVFIEVMERIVKR